MPLFVVAGCEQTDIEGREARAGVLGGSAIYSLCSDQWANQGFTPLQKPLQRQLDREKIVQSFQYLMGEFPVPTQLYRSGRIAG